MPKQLLFWNSEQLKVPPMHLATLDLFSNYSNYDSLKREADLIGKSKKVKNPEIYLDLMFKREAPTQHASLRPEPLDQPYPVLPQEFNLLKVFVQEKSLELNRFLLNEPKVYVINPGYMVCFDYNRCLPFFEDAERVLNPTLLPKEVKEKEGKRLIFM